MTYAAGASYPESLAGFTEILGRITAGASPRGTHGTRSSRFQYVSKYAYDLVRLSLAAVAAIRSEAEKPDADLPGMYQAATTVSRAVAKLVRKLGKHPGFAALKPLFSNVLTEWEDLAEDLALVQSSDGREILGRICETLASRSDQDQDWRQLDCLR